MIEARQVSKLYGRGVYALRELSLRVDKGEFVFLTGPSGAGKSTLLRLLLRRDVPSEGELIVGGRNLAELGPRQVQSYRRSLGFVFQDFKLGAIIFLPFELSLILLFGGMLLASLGG